MNPPKKHGKYLVYYYNGNGLSKHFIARFSINKRGELCDLYVQYNYAGKGINDTTKFTAKCD